MKKLLALVMALAMAVTVLAACGGDAPSSTAASTPADTTSTPADSSEPEAPAAAGGEVVINLASEPPEMNSITTTSTGSMNVLRHIVDGLTVLGQDDAPVAAAAESWEYDEETFTYTFKIRQGQNWSNGEPVTAHDFVFAWTTHFTADTGAEYAGTWAPLILGAEQLLNGTTDADVSAKLTELGYEDIGFMAVDDYTLQVTTSFSVPYFLDVLAFPSFMPVNQKAYDEIGGDAYGTEAEYLITNGAFKVASWAHESNIVLEKNTEYWDAASVNLDKITMEMISDTGTALNSFVAEELDMIGLNAVQSDQLTGEGRNVQYYSDASVWYFEFNNSLPGLNNAKVRKALTLAVDAQGFIDNIVRNNSQVATGLVPPAIKNGDFNSEVAALDLYPRVTDGDYSEIKALFEEGLTEEGLTVADLNWSIITDEGDTARNNVAFYQEQWKQNLGVEIEIEQMTYKLRLQRMTEKDFSIVMAGWSMDYNDPMTYLDLFVTDGGNNHTWYSNTAYDALIAEALTETDADKRMDLLVDVEKIIAEDYPIGLIYYRNRAFVTSDRLTGVVRTAAQDFNLRWAKVA